MFQRKVSAPDQLAFDESQVLMEQLLVTDDSMVDGDHNIRNGTPHFGQIIGLFKDWDIFQTFFIRGDADRNAKVDLSDAVTILGYLYLGTAEDRCLDAMDVDNSDTIDLADPVSLLQFLFLGRDIHLDPYPECGFENPGDELWCSEPEEVCKNL